MPRAGAAGPAAILLPLLLACTPAPEEPRPPAPEGTAEANCTRELLRRSRGLVRINSVTIFEQQRGVVTGSSLGNFHYTCFTNPQGEVVNVTVDRPFD